MQTISQSAPKGGSVSVQQVEQVIAQACPAESYRGKRVLLIVPDGTRTAPVGLMFKTLHRQLSGVTKALDVLIALGTHQPMSEEAICGRLEISPAQRKKIAKNAAKAKWAKWAAQNKKKSGENA